MVIQNSLFSDAHRFPGRELEVYIGTGSAAPLRGGAGGDVAPMHDL